jgi:hypothetical protein
VSDRIPSDHDAVSTERVHLSAVGRTSRLQVPLPESVSCRPDDRICLAVDGTNLFAQVERTLDGEPAVRGAFETRRLARTSDGTDRLGAWLDSAGFEDGDPLCLDVLTEGYAYGLRAPGARVVYSPPPEPDRSLDSIAQNLTERE